MKRLAVACVAAIGLLLPSVSAQAGNVVRTTRQFGTIIYTEAITSRSRDELPIIGAPDKLIRLSLDMPVPIGGLAILDTRTGMSIDLRGERCLVSTGIDGYRDLSIAGIRRHLVGLRTDCNWSDAAIANTSTVIDRNAGDLLEAIRYMRRRAIALLGSDLRCDPNLSPKQPRPMVLDGTPPALCHDGKHPAR